MAYGTPKKKEEVQVEKNKGSATVRKMARMSNSIGVNLNRPETKGDNLNREHPSLKI